MHSPLSHSVRLTASRRGLRRRDFLRGMAACGGAALGGSLPGSGGYRDVLGLHAAELEKRNRACIVLWMQGGPSQLETFDPKPGHANGGETKAIDTNVAGIQLADNLPNLAKVADELAIVRSLTGREGEHLRATYLMHTAYLPGGGVRYPSLGAVVAKENKGADCELPPYVRFGGGRGVAVAGAGLLGTAYDPFVVSVGGRAPENTSPTTDAARFRSRLQLAARLQDASGMSGVAEQKELYRQASEMILSPKMEGFDTSREDAAVRDAYGTSTFGAGCLAARRLVERGVSFVEVELNGWDTHDNNFQRVRGLCNQLDQPYAALIRDLRDRGLLDSTLVVWVGEFGRTPRINPRGGRDHFPRAFSAVLAGGGVRGGRVLGATDAGGEAVTDRPVSERDFFCTVYRSLGIDPHKENMSPIGRPIKLVDGGEPIDELFG